MTIVLPAARGIAVASMFMIDSMWRGMHRIAVVCAHRRGMAGRQENGHGSKKGHEQTHSGSIAKKF